MVISRVRADAVNIELHPNRSATWHQTKLLIALLAVFVGIIALGWAFVGVWVILPFAGLEVGLLAFMMYRVSHFTYQTQCIDITTRCIFVSSSPKEPTVELNRACCHVEFEHANTWQLPTIHLVDQHNLIEIGQFLNLEDKQKLRHTLERAGLMTCQRQWWR